MPVSTASERTITLECASKALTFENVELQRDAHAIIIKMNITNPTNASVLVSSQYFMLVADNMAVYPHVSYVADPQKQGMLCTWKRLHAQQSCTMILQYSHVSSSKQYVLKMQDHKQIHTIKHFFNE